MGKLTRKKVNICDLCSGIIRKSLPASTSTYHRKLTNFLWNYLYHKNVKESILSFNTEENEEYSRIPKLTFSLTLGKAIQQDNNKTLVKMCTECIEELEELDKLHQQLESVKEIINCQIDKINDKRLNNKATKLNRRMRSSGKINSTMVHNIQPTAGINFGGCSIGKENISQTLTFLSTICDGISDASPSIAPVKSRKVSRAKIQVGKQPSSTAPPPIVQVKECQTSETSSTKTNVKIEIPSEETNLVEDVGNNGQDNESLPTEEFEMMSDEQKSLKFDIGEEFVSIVKLEDGLNEDDENAIQVPEKDPLEIPTDLKKRKRKYAKRPDFPVGKGPKSLPCRLCKTMVFRWNWETHQKWHAGEKQFKCELCNEGFTLRKSMYRHQRKKHKIFE